MKRIRVWKKAFAVFVSVVSTLGIKLPVGATALTISQSDSTDPPAGEDVPLAQACPEGQTRQLYARVTTRDPNGSLNIRSRPSTGGAVIGSVPNRWEVVVIEREPSGQWARITSHWGDPHPYGFGSAPDFREGWVSASFLRTLGRFCDKPSDPYSLIQPELFGDRTVVVQDDWLETADHIVAHLDR
ncbi:SH3 domain-containing protein [Oscillatoria sp. FACHB-1407]|uniref:SH3 domain-containing protein n=1 Tax=Oscillatoria sp. FACHB-1407 TaxID=2692847 RepID=UPI001683D8B1|nr:SH3 domain-containing protein [Oscillatoria sp. FACHB-1407]MBD2465153.1 SH3 domain-containing protein [Oscillatoria sp. FACHB-1407]